MAQGMSSKEKARGVRQSGLPENRSDRDRLALRGERNEVHTGMD